MGINKWIDFGEVSAERDNQLTHYFYDNGVLQKVISNQHSFLLLGRKGAGKTALFKYFGEHKSKYLNSTDEMISLSLEDYNWNIHALLRTDEGVESLAYKMSWRFAILVEALRSSITNLERRNLPVPDKLKKADKLLQKVFGSPVPSLLSLIGEKVLKVSKLSLPKGGIDLEGGDLDSLELGGGEISFSEVNSTATLQSSLSQNIVNLLRVVEAAIYESLPLSGKVYICFDRIDDAWVDGSYELSKKIIAGLVSAADSITQKFKGNIRPIIFLREDIFEVLPINDLNKLREDAGALLKWDRDSLLSLILTRVNYFARKNGKDEVTDLDNLFDRKEMKQRSKPSNYLTKRSMMRPRDMICFLNRIKKSMQETENDPFAEEKTVFSLLNGDSVYEAESGYSEWLRNELIDEWNAQYPRIKDILSAIQNIGLAVIDGETWKQRITQVTGEISDAEHLQILKFMFDNSIIGFQIGSSTQWKYKCFYPSQGFLESANYRVHEGLIRGMNLRDTREGG